jgi:hypothetical protein
MLVRALGETRCRQCSWVRQREASERGSGDTALADEVAAALRRRFGG